MSRKLEAAGGEDTKQWSELGLEKQRVHTVTNLMGPFSSVNCVLDELHNQSSLISHGKDLEVHVQIEVGKEVRGVCVCVHACAHTFQEQPEGIFYSAGASLKAGRLSF